MRTLYRFIAALAAAMLLVCICQSFALSAAQTSADDDAIQDVIAAANETFVALFNRNDASGVAATYTEDGKIMPPEGEMLEGRAVLQDRWQLLFDNGFVGVNLETVEAHAMGDTAAEVGEYTLFDGMGDVLENGRYVVIWKLVDGEWLRDRNVFSSDVPDEISRVATPRENGAFADVNGIEMYYEIYGEGEPLLLLPGAMGNTGDFDEVKPAFVDAGFQTVALDYRGQGRSTDSGEMRSYALMTEDVVALMDELGIERAHVAGQSDGAIVGLHMAIYYPERLGRLVAYGGNATVNGLLPGNIEWLNSLTHEDMEAIFGEEYRAIAPNPDYLPVMLERLRHMFLTSPNYTMDQLMAIESPVLIFDGEEEDTVRIEHVKMMAAAIPDAQLVILPETGHHLMYEDPERYLETALPFLLGELDAPPPGKYAAINDIAMYYEIHGEGEPLFLIHSVAAGMEQLRDVIPVLAEEYQVIAVDFRGHGRTTDSGQPLRYELLASDMLALMDNLGVQSVHIVGNKDGGIIGLQMAMSHPERVNRLVAASANYSPAGFQPWFSDYLKGFTLEDWDAMAGDMYRELSPTPEIMPVMLQKDRAMLLTEPNFTLDDLGAIASPVLVLAGADEDVLEVEPCGADGGCDP